PDRPAPPSRRRWNHLPWSSHQRRRAARRHGRQTPAHARHLPTAAPPSCRRQAAPSAPIAPPPATLISLSASTPTQAGTLSLTASSSPPQEAAMLTQQASSRYPGSDLLHGTGIDFFLPDLSTRMAVAAYHARPDTR